jgi:hypothetical protein
MQYQDVPEYPLPDVIEQYPVHDGVKICNAEKGRIFCQQLYQLVLRDGAYIPFDSCHGLFDRFRFIKGMQ